MARPFRPFKIRASPTLRKEIMRIINENNLSIYILCEEINEKYSEFVMWLNAINGGNTSGELAENKTVNLCKLLGIEVCVTFRLHKIPESSLELLKNKSITKAHNKIKEKRAREIKEFFED